MTRVTFDSKALKKVRDIYSKRANEVAKNIAPTVYNIEVTTEDREITNSLATLNTVFYHQEIQLNHHMYHDKF